MCCNCLVRKLQKGRRCIGSQLFVCEYILLGTTRDVDLCVNMFSDEIPWTTDVDVDDGT